MQLCKGLQLMYLTHKFILTCNILHNFSQFLNLANLTKCRMINKVWLSLESGIAENKV